LNIYKYIMEASGKVLANPTIDIDIYIDKKYIKIDSLRANIY